MDRARSSISPGSVASSFSSSASARDSNFSAAASFSASSARARLESVDLLRGIVMILMALDHVRDYLGAPGISPTNLAQTTVGLFMTRWVTHLCAPVFFLLTGTGAYLALGRRTKSELSRFLWTRGLWLIFLEIVVLRCFAMQFNFDFRLTMLVVIWAMGDDRARRAGVLAERGGDW